MTKEEMFEAVMNQTNWTGLTLRQLANAGRIVPGSVVENWVDSWYFSEEREGKGRRQTLLSLREEVQNAVAQCNK